MYCEFYSFREKPFTLTPNPDFIFLSRIHKEAFAHLLYGIDNHAGFIELTGEVGTGKTTVVRTLLGQLENETYRTALIFNPCVSALGLLQGISREFGLPSGSAERAELLEGINRFLLDEKAAGRTVVLVVDEAQNLEPPVLEQIRLLSNLETERDKLIQIILVGQPELRDLLNRSDLRQLAQRITVRYHLDAMDAEDTAAYIRHRITRAAGRETVTFTPGAIRLVYRFSGGVPRLINAVCDRMLLAGYSLGATSIDAALARRAVREVRREERGQGGRRKALPALVVLVILVAVMGVASFQWRGRKAPTAVVSVLPAPSEADRLQFFDVVRLLDRQTPVATAVAAVNAVLPSWGATTLAADSVPGAEVSFSGLAALRGLDVYSFTGRVDDLLKLDLPAIIEISTSSSEKRYLAFTGTRHGFLQIETASGQQAFGEGEISHYWTGRAWVIWRNALNIPVPLTVSAAPEKVAAFQELLRSAGLYGGPVTGKVDQPTQVALRRFQENSGIPSDGALGVKTLLLLYRKAGQGEMPTLGKEKGES